MLLLTFACRAPQSWALVGQGCSHRSCKNSVSQFKFLLRKQGRPCFSLSPWLVGGHLLSFPWRLLQLFGSVFTCLPIKTEIIVDESADKWLPLSAAPV